MQSQNIKKPILLISKFLVAHVVYLSYLLIKASELILIRMFLSTAEAFFAMLDFKEAKNNYAQAINID